MIDLKVGEACTLSSFATLTGLKIDAMHLAVQMGLRKHDKYAILENIDQMSEEAKKNSYGRIQVLSGPHIEAAEAEMKLEDLRRWFVTQFLHNNFENCDKVMEMRRALAEKEEELKQKDEEMKKMQQEWEVEKKKIAADVDEMNKKDEWSKRVTYEGVVEQIAACEDPSKRDDARRLVEPLLSKSQVTQFRRDIKRRVKELNEESGTPNITIGNVAGDFNVNKAVKQIGN